MVLTSPSDFWICQMPMTAVICVGKNIDPTSIPNTSPSPGAGQCTIA